MGAFLSGMLPSPVFGPIFFNIFVTMFDKDILVVNDTDQPEQGEK